MIPKMDRKRTEIGLTKYIQQKAQPLRCALIISLPDVCRMIIQSPLPLLPFPPEV